MQFRTIPLSGSPDQVEWAERIRLQVSNDFDRVEAAFRLVAAGQDPGKRAGTEAILRILDDKRNEVLRRTEAGYFIKDWQELSDQVRQLIYHDPRYPRRAVVPSLI